MAFKKKPWIKICGLTDPENALECATLGADAIGLVFFEKSPRNVSIKRAASISTILPDHILSIGVFVNTSYEEIMEKAVKCSLKGVQLHGNEPPALVGRLLKQNLVVIKAVFAAKSPFMNQALNYQNASFILVENGNGKLPGGNAEIWDYERSLQIETRTPVVLSGGLSSDTVCQAITAVNPDGVDVSSGVEKCPGIKDLVKVKSFIHQIASL